MSSVGYGDLHYGISNYGSPQYEQASCSISASSGGSASPTVQFNLLNETINAQSGLSGSINTIFQTTANSSGASSVFADYRRIKQGFPQEAIQNSGSLVHGTQIDQAETFIQVISGSTSVGNQIDQGASAISVSSGSQQIGTQIDLGQTSFTETSSSTTVGTQIDLGSVNPIAVSQTVSVGTQIDLGASASCLPTSNVTTLNPLFTENIINVDYYNNIFRLNQNVYSMSLKKNILNNINQTDSSNVGNTLALSQAPDGHHNTSNTHVSVRTDNNSRTYLQVSGAFNGTTSGGSATNQKRTLYRYVPDSYGGSPTYTGTGWGYVYYQTSPITDDLVTATVGSITVSGYSMMTINGYPAYQFAGDYSKETANGVGGQWEAFEIDGSSQTNSAGTFVSDSTIYETGITTTGTVGSNRKLSLTPSASTPQLYYFSLENSGKGSTTNLVNFEGVESIFLLVGGSVIDTKSELFSEGVRRYFGISELTSASGVSSSGGLKWTKQSVANTTWTEQKQAQ